jgi:hypothetical protein
MLALEEVHIIEKQVSAANIHYSHLKDDLIDHICCDVEQMMDNGYKFSDAYNEVRERIGYRGLKKIQDDTFYLIDKTYRTMKKLMKITGLIAPALLGIGSIFKIFHWPGAGPLLVLGFFVLCFFFLPTSIYILYQETKNKKNVFTYVSGFLAATLYSAGVLFRVMHFPFGQELLFAGVFIAVLIFLPVLFITKLKGVERSSEKSSIIVGLIALTILLIGFVFKIMHWPGAGILLVLGNVSLFLVAVPFYGIVLTKNKKYTPGQFVFIIIAASWVVMSLNLISINSSKSLHTNYQHLYQELIENKEALLKSNAHFVSIDTLTTTRQINHSSTQIISLIDNIKKTLVRMDNPQNPFLEDISIKSLQYLKHPYSRELVKNYMLGLKNDGRAYELQSKLKSHISILHNSLPNAESKKWISKIAPELNNDNWVENKFHGTLYYTLSYLTVLQQKILLTESKIQLNSFQNSTSINPQNQES